MPDSLPVTEETRERLREQANQLPEPTVLRLIDLLAVAVDDMRQGGDPRLPLELALVKVTRPAPTSRASRSRTGSSCSKTRRPVGQPASAGTRGSRLRRRRCRPAEPPSRRSAASAAARARAAPGRVAAQRGPRGPRERSIPVATLLREARPAELDGDTLTLEFAPAADFHRRQVEDPKNLTSCARRSTR